MRRMEKGGGDIKIFLITFFILTNPPAIQILGPRQINSNNITPPGQT